MNILQVHKFFWQRDGASNYFFTLSDLLTQHGHMVVPFAMQHPHNLPSQYERFFVSERDLSNPKQYSLGQKIQTAGRMFYSFEAKHKLTALLRTYPIDVAHLHNIYHHISPSILPVLKKRNIPIVMTLHDYKLVSPNYSLFHHGKIHLEDAEGWYWNCIKNKCHKDSTAQSALMTAEMIFHHKIMKYYERYVDYFIAPSQFMKDLCVRMGWNEKRFIALPHPIELHEAIKKDPKKYIAYVGRLSEEKGLFVLLHAAKKLPHISFKIVGTGPLSEKMKQFLEKEKMHNVELTGFKTGKELQDLITNAYLLVLPSVWYENYPISILEAKASGKIMLGSKIGGIPELLAPEFLFQPGHVDELIERINFWYTVSKSEYQRVGNRLRNEVKKYNDPEAHVEAILRLYNKALKEI